MNIFPEVSKEHVEAQRYQTKSRQSRLVETKKQLAQDYKDSPHLPYWLMTIDYGIYLDEARIAWCDNAVKTLEKLNQRSKT